MIKNFKNSTNPKIKKQNNLKNWEDEWTVLNDTFYFKKSAAYLFKDYNYLYLYFVAKTRFAVNFNLKLKIYESNSNQHLEEIFFENLQSSRIIIWGNRDSDHGLYTLKAYFKQSENLKKYLTRKELAIHAFPFISNQIISKNPIILKIKNKKEKLKKDIMVCSKMLSLENKDYKILEDWIRIHKQIGYQKIVLHNNSIPNTSNFNNLFLKNQDFVVIKENKFYPDIINNSNVFISSSRKERLR